MAGICSNPPPTHCILRPLESPAIFRTKTQALLLSTRNFSDSPLGCSFHPPQEIPLVSWKDGITHHPEPILRPPFGCPKLGKPLAPHLEPFLGRPMVAGMQSYRHPLGLPSEVCRGNIPWSLLSLLWSLGNSAVDIQFCLGGGLLGPHWPLEHMLGLGTWKSCQFPDGSAQTCSG